MSIQGVRADLISLDSILKFFTPTPIPILMRSVKWSFELLRKHGKDPYLRDRIVTATLSFIQSPTVNQVRNSRSQPRARMRPPKRSSSPNFCVIQFREASKAVIE